MSRPQCYLDFNIGYLSKDRSPKSGKADYERLAEYADGSGTNKKELALWEKVGVSNSQRAADWYKETGSGMGATLNTASGLGAYVLSDRATWLKFGNKGELNLLYAGDPQLFNQYALLPVSAQMHPQVD